MLAYLDSSAVLDYLLRGDLALKHALKYPRIVSSELLEIECRRVFHRYHMIGELTEEGLVTVHTWFSDLCTTIDILELSLAVKKRAAESFPISIKTLDALHLSSALVLQAEEPEKITVFSYDKTMNLCAKALGFAAPFSV